MMELLGNITLPILFFLSSLYPKNTYVEGVSGQPLSLNPLKIEKSGIEKTITSLVFRNLFKYNSDGVLVPDLVDDWRVSDDGLTYTITLKKGQRFHDGREITANDVLFTASKTKKLREIAFDKLSLYSVKFRLPNKFSPFLSLLDLPIVSSNYGDNLKDFMPIGSGDFKVVRVTKKGSKIKSIILQTESNKYKIRRIVFKFYDNEEDLPIAAKLGEIDGFRYDDDFDNEYFSSFEGVTTGRYFGIFFNTKREPLDDPNIRRLLASNINVDTLIKDVLGSRGEKAMGPLSRTWAQKKDLKAPTASDSLEVSKDTVISLTVPDTYVHKATAQFIKDSWGKIGIKTDIRAVSLSDIKDNIIPKRDFEVILMGQEVPRDPDRYVIWHSTQVESPGLNFTGFESIRVDKALEEGREVLDKSERIKHYDLMQRLIVQESPAIFLYHPIFRYYVNKNFKGINISNLYLPYERFWNLESWEN